MDVYLKAAVYALFAAGGGAIVGSLFDSGADHVHAQTLAILAGIVAFGWRVKQG